jgi:hypothetical protein
MPDNAIYFEIAYLATAAVLFGYIVSIFWRQRAVRARLLAERSVEGR